MSKWFEQSLCWSQAVLSSVLRGSGGLQRSGLAPISQGCGGPGPAGPCWSPAYPAPCRGGARMSPFTVYVTASPVYMLSSWRTAPARKINWPVSAVLKHKIPHVFSGSTICTVQGKMQEESIKCNTTFLPSWVYLWLQFCEILPKHPLSLPRGFEPLCPRSQAAVCVLSCNTQ